MSRTNSIGFPNMFDIAHNRVNLVEDKKSIVNRTKLLMLTEPTELYNSPTFGVGLKEYLWQYNTKNTRAIIQNRIKDQLREHEPCVDADSTQFMDDLISTSIDQKDSSEFNTLKMTVGLRSIYGDELEVGLDEHI